MYFNSINLLHWYINIIKYFVILSKTLENVSLNSSDTIYYDDTESDYSLQPESEDNETLPHDQDEYPSSPVRELSSWSSSSDQSSDAESYSQKEIIRESQEQIDNPPSEASSWNLEEEDDQQTNDQS